MHTRDHSTVPVASASRAPLSALRPGRVIGLCLASAGIAVQAMILARQLTTAFASDLAGVVHTLASALSLMVYLLMVGAYLLRREDARSDASVLARCIAVAVTFLPILMPLWPGRTISTATDLVASVILAIGLAGCVWSLRHLWTNFSVIPQARVLVASGPYRWVRHPLYTTEIIASLGLALHFGRPYHWVLLALLVSGQVYRARREERLLVVHVPGYAEYQARTAALVPRLRWRMS